MTSYSRVASWFCHFNGLSDSEINLAPHLDATHKELMMFRLRVHGVALGGPFL